MFSGKRTSIGRISSGTAYLEQAEPAHGSINSRLKYEIYKALQLQIEAQIRQYIFRQWCKKLEQDYVQGVIRRSASISCNHGSIFFRA